jgi:3-oxoadipate enol-lactonase
MMPDRPRLPAADVQVARAGAGPPVVLLHCLGVDRRLWDPTVEALGDTLELIAYDLPGHGQTPVPAQPYTIEDLAEQLAELLDRERIERAHVAGISLGGLIAQQFAARYPDRVDRLVLIDTTARYTDELRAMWVRRAQIARTAGVAALADDLLKIWFTPEFIAAAPPAVGYVRDCFARMSGEGYALACEALGAADLEPVIGMIKARTLVVCGDRDIPSFLDAARHLHATIPDSRLEWLSPAAHASILEQPAAFNRLLREFLC